MLTDEQVKTIKKQIISQIEASFPADKKDFARKRIESMNSEELEAFLVKNNLAISQAGSGPQATNQGVSQQCIFCLIVSGDIESHKIAENEYAIVVLEINPVSRGHTLIIPKEHSLIQGKEKEDSIKKLMKSVSGIIKKKLKPKKILVSKSNLFGHETINIIPQFNKETANSQRHSATPEELIQLKSLLTISEKKKGAIAEGRPKVIKVKAEEKMWLPRRIP